MTEKKRWTVRKNSKERRAERENERSGCIEMGGGEDLGRERCGREKRRKMALRTAKRREGVQEYKERKGGERKGLSVREA